MFEKQIGQSHNGPRESTFWDVNTTFSLVIAPVILLAIVAAFFGDVLFLPGKEVLSSSREGTDLFSQFVYYKDFGFSELRKGNLALWNPHIFSGLPFFGGLPSLLLSLAKAINVEIALDVFLAGAI